MPLGKHKLRSLYYFYVLLLTMHFAIQHRYTDYSLASTIGRADGNVYEAIYNEVKRSPLNQSSKMVGWAKLKAILDIDFIRAGVGQRWAPPCKL